MCKLFPKSVLWNKSLVFEYFHSPLQRIISWRLEPWLLCSAQSFAAISKWMRQSLASNFNHIVCPQIKQALEIHYDSENQRCYIQNPECLCSLVWSKTALKLLLTFWHLTKISSQQHVDIIRGETLMGFWIKHVCKE